MPAYKLTALVNPPETRIKLGFWLMVSDLLKPSGLGITFDGGVGTARVYSETAERIQLKDGADDDGDNHECPCLA